jgi:hypothetical protein
MMKYLFALVLAWPSPAAADASSAQAEALFRHGRELLAAGKTADACAAFDASQKLDAATTTLFNQADCREKNGQLATAWGEFVDAERQTRAAADAVGVKMHKVAVDRAAKLEPRLSKLTVHVAGQNAGLVVLRNGEPIDAGEWNRALPIDGGTYTLTARIGDREVWSETLTIGVERDARDVVVVVQSVAQRATPAPVATAPIVAPPVAASPSSSRLAPLVATIGAGALLGGALVFDLWGDRTYNDAVAKHDVSLWNSANTKRYVAEGMLVGGIACAGVATYLWLRGGGREEPRRAVAPVASSGFAGLQLAGSW